MGSSRVDQNGEPVLQYGRRQKPVAFISTILSLQKWGTDFTIELVVIVCSFHRCGRCKLQNVKVLNEGIDWNFGDNVYWKHVVQRIEACKVVLHGNAEFEATDVILKVSLSTNHCRYAQRKRQILQNC